MPKVKGNWKNILVCCTTKRIVGENPYQQAKSNHVAPVKNSVAINGKYCDMFDGCHFWALFLFTMTYVCLCVLVPFVTKGSLLDLFELEKSVNFLKWVLSWHWYFGVLPHGLAAIILFCNNLLLRLVDTDRRMYFLWLVSCLFFVLVAVKRSKSVVLFLTVRNTCPVLPFFCFISTPEASEIFPVPVHYPPPPPPNPLSSLSCLGVNIFLLPAFKYD